jgi:hypothetical protein
MMRAWQAESDLLRNGVGRISRVYIHESGCRAEVSIHEDGLWLNFGNIPDSLEAKKKRTESVLDAMLEQFFSRPGNEPKLNQCFKIDENQVDLDAIAKRLLA